LSSSAIESPEADAHYAEKLYRLPSFPTFHKKFEKPMDVSRSEFPVPANGTLYFCPLRIPKYHPMFDEYLKEILDRDPNGTLLILAGGPEHPREQLQARLHRHFGKVLMERIVFFTSIPNDIYYRLMSICEVVLDSPVYAGDLTTHDAFSFGIPVVTQQGPLLVQRYTSGLYEMMGLNDLIAQDKQKYVDLAIKLGTDKEYRQLIRSEIESKSDCLFNNEQLVRDFETFIDYACQNAV
jgi:predicted O-linked N-acetylglucosamine transferase (SPINDLY family)